MRTSSDGSGLWVSAAELHPPYLTGRSARRKPDSGRYPLRNFEGEQDARLTYQYV